MSEDIEDYTDEGCECVTVQCGECYRHYVLEDNIDECPFCGSDEIVGDR